MRTTGLSKVFGIAAIAAGLGLAGPASAEAITTIYNFVPLGGLTSNTGDVTTMTSVTPGAPLVVGAIVTDNTGLATGDSITLTSPTPVTLGAEFTKSWETLLYPGFTFTETLTVTSVQAQLSSLGILAEGTITCGGCGLDDSPIFYSASYTQNAGPGTQINASYNNSTTPPNGVPEPATLALLGAGLAGIGFSRRRKQ